MRVLLDADSVSRGLRRVAGEIVERHRGVEGLVLVAVRRGGIPVADRIAYWIRELERRDIPVGSVDITLYRDDAATALPNPRIGPSDIPCALEGARVVLVDDVLFTGRTVRAAIDALIDYGRPRRIELAVVIDRGGRELPIAADYVVRAVEVPPGERVDVIEDDDGLRAVVQPSSTPTRPPAAPRDE
jgi:pyrimidine operon attenuation protein/uracil phosphoribosyltransferase